jgi:Protein of unknown function (DUF2800)
MSKHSQRAHARKFQPSSSKRWINCPGSIRLSAGIPDTSSVFADEGTAAHQAAEKILRGELREEKLIGHTETVNGQDFTIDEEAAEAIMLYVETCREYMTKAKEFIVEQRLDMTHIATDMFGTADFVAYSEDESTVTVCDLKFGRGVAVEADDPQLLIYAMGAAKLFHNRGLRKIEMVVVQPRCYHPDGPVRRYKIDPADLLDHEADIIDAAKRAEKDDAALNPGSWCKFCKAAAICPAMAKVVDEAAKMEFGEPAPVTAMTPKELSKTLAKVDLVEDWCRRVREYAFAEAQRGRVAPGWKLVQKRALRKWTDEDNAARLLANLGVSDDEMFSKKLVSPAAAEKLVGKKGVALLGDLIAKESSGVTLVSEDDPRPAVAPDAANEFAA